MTKEQIFTEVMVRINDDASKLDLNRLNVAILWAGRGAEVLSEHGFRVMIQGGSVEWPMPLQFGDGMDMAKININYHSNEESEAEVIAGKLPQMHCWLSLPDFKQTVDLSVGNIKTSYASLLKNAVASYSPLEVVWFDWGKAPEGYMYYPDSRATAIAAKVWQDLSRSMDRQVVMKCSCHRIRLRGKWIEPVWNMSGEFKWRVCPSCSAGKPRPKKPGPIRLD